MTTGFDSWAISDTHFGHQNVIKYDNRPFKNAAAMDAALITNWNNVVKPNDIVYHLGDFAFHAEDMVCNILNQLNGRKILILGNHDKVMRTDIVSKYFEKITNYLEVYEDKQLICMFHYPIAEFNKAHRGAFHIHGHCHGNYKPHNPGRIMDVGANCINYTPINLKQVIKQLEKEPLLKHH